MRAIVVVMVMPVLVVVMVVFVIVIVFPSLATSPGDTQRLRRAIQAVAALGVCTVLGALVLPDLVVKIVGGPDYAPVGPIAWRGRSRSRSLTTITVSVTAAEARMPARDTFAWTVLSALAGSVDSRLGPDDRVLLTELVKEGQVVGRETVQDARARHIAALEELPGYALQLSRGYPAIPTVFGRDSGDD